MAIEMTTEPETIPPGDLAAEGRAFSEFFTKECEPVWRDLGGKDPGERARLNSICWKVWRHQKEATP